MFPESIEEPPVFRVSAHFPGYCKRPMIFVNLRLQRKKIYD